jgi:peroxiredoxin
MKNDKDYNSTILKNLNLRSGDEFNEMELLSDIFDVLGIDYQFVNENWQHQIKTHFTIFAFDENGKFKKQMLNSVTEIQRTS